MKMVIGIVPLSQCRTQLLFDRIAPIVRLEIQKLQTLRFGAQELRSVSKQSCNRQPRDHLVTVRTPGQCCSRARKNRQDGGSNDILDFHGIPASFKTQGPLESDLCSQLNVSADARARGFTE